MSNGNALERLQRLLQMLPGIGPRQAARFAYALVDEDPRDVAELGKAIMELRDVVMRCQRCGRAVGAGEPTPCVRCKNEETADIILVLEKDQDYDNVRRSGVHHGGVHLLHGLIALGEHDSMVRARIKALYARVAVLQEGNAEKIEIVLGLSPTPEGDATSQYIAQVLAPFIEQGGLTISRMARGLSSGADLEYADADTLKHAFERRSRA